MSPRPSAPRRPPTRKSSPPTRARREGPPRRRPLDGLGGEQVEGRQSVLELLLAGRRRTKRIMLVDGLEPAPILDAIEREARRVHAPVQLVSATRLDREARTEGHQGVMAIADPMPTVALEELLENPRALLLVADSVSDPRNLGAILRSADGAGVTGVVLPSHRSARLTPAVTKTAAGAIEYLSFAEVPGIPSAVERLRKSGVRVLGLDGESRTSIYDLNLHDGPVAVVVGGEAKGLSALTRKRCDDLVALPQRGAMKSLNAAVAASVALYEVSRQRR